jgi:hypothetical protein
MAAKCSPENNPLARQNPLFEVRDEKMYAFRFIRPEDLFDCSKTRKRRENLSGLAGCTPGCRNTTKPRNNQFDDGSFIVVFSLVRMPRAAAAEEAQ